MQIFIYCHFNDLFFTGRGFTENFMECMFFNNVSVAMSCLNMFIHSNTDYDLNDFDMYFKCEVY